MYSIDLVTIGIPSYNRPNTLKRAIDSARSQTYKNIEIYISDNCSSNIEVDDVIASAIKEDNRIKYIKQNHNIGGAKNFSYILQHAKGEFFMWLADDDFISPNYVERIVGELKKNNDFSLICGQSYFINSKTNIKVKNEVMNLFDASAPTRLINYLKTTKTNSIVHGIFYTKNSFDYDMDWYGFDWLHLSRLAFKGKFKTLDDVYLYRENNGASNQNYSYSEIRKIFLNVYEKIKFDLETSILYNELSSKELNKLIIDIKLPIINYAPMSSIIKKKIFNIIKKAIKICSK